MSKPEALLLTAPGCPHCPGVKMALQRLQSEGLIATLEVVDIATQPERATEFGVRSVPWLRLGEFILSGAQTPQQLREWAERATDPSGMSDYLRHLLQGGELAAAEAVLGTQPHHLGALLPLLEDPSSPIQVRLGASALLEGFEGDEALRALLPRLIALSEHPDHRLRSDACHLLGLTHAEQARDALQRCSQDAHEEVRDIAVDALLSLNQPPQ